MPHFEYPDNATPFLRSSINVLLQDQRGFLWIGTGDGLGRFDGQQVIEFRHHRGDTVSLRDNQITELVEDRQGRIWVGTGKGLHCFQPETGAFERIPQLVDEVELVQQRVYHLMIDRKGFVWWSTPYWLHRLDPVSGQQWHYTTSSSDAAADIPADFVYWIHEDHRGRIWLGTVEGITYFENTLPFSFETIFPEPGVAGKLAHDRIFNFREQADGTLWAGGFAGLVRIENTDSLHFEHFTYRAEEKNGLSHNFVSTLLIDSKDRIWAGTFAGGLNKIELSGKNKKEPSFTSYQSENGNPFSIGSNKVNTLLEDRSGILWIGTPKGLMKMAVANWKFQKVSSRLYDSTSLSNNTVNCFARDSVGNLWVGTEDGLNFLTAEKWRQRNFSFRVFRAGETISSATLSSNKIEDLLVDRHQILWISTYLAPNFIDLRNFFEQPRFRFVGTTNKGTTDGIPHTWVLGMKEIAPHEYWIATYNGLVKMDFNPREPFPLSMNVYSMSDHPDSLLNGQVLEVEKDGKNRYWVSTIRGLSKFVESPQGAYFENYTHDPARPESLASNRINDLFLDSKQRFWIGTDEGLNLLLPGMNGERDKFHNYGIQEKFPSLVINTINEDQGGRLWLGTNRGVIHFDPDAALESESAILGFYNFRNGLRAYRVHSSFQDKEGMIFMGVDDGFIFFDPMRMPRNSFVPPVELTRIKISGKRAGEEELILALDFTEKINLQHDQNNFTLRFVALDYTNPVTNQYKYCLQGLNEEWQSSGNNTEVSYTNLSPGTYTFQVIGSNSDGQWNETASQLLIHIHPPWWQSWWAYSGYIALLLGLLYAYIRFRIHRVTYRIEEQARLSKVRFEEREKLRKKNAADFHDELGHRLTKVSLFLELAERESAETAPVRAWLQKIKVNVTELADGIRDMIWSLDPEQDTLEQTLNRLQEFGDELFEYSTTKFETRRELAEIGKTTLSADSRKQLLLLFKEAMNNTLKYAEATTAVLSATKNEGHVEIVFMDNGCGFDAEYLKKGYGLKNMEKRAMSIGGLLNVSTEKERGTRVSLMISID